MLVRKASAADAGTSHIAEVKSLALDGMTKGTKRISLLQDGSAVVNLPRIGKDPLPIGYVVKALSPDVWRAFVARCRADVHLWTTVGPSAEQAAAVENPIAIISNRLGGGEEDEADEAATAAAAAMAAAKLEDLFGAVLPHVGRDWEDKAKFLCHMMTRLAYRDLDHGRDLDDRDRLEAKRIDCAGALVEELFCLKVVSGDLRRKAIPKVDHYKVTTTISNALRTGT